MRSQEIRQTFLDFFAEKGHQIVPSSPLVPGNDKTLLFTNAGMVQFKDVFLGMDKRDYSRAVTAQRCVRAGGKHNDLENVGYTARHHTFFEMLGNFSFGDYFKDRAIAFAWELITERFGLPKEKLWITIYEEDDEAYDIWANKIGVPTERISRIGAKDNFWQMGDTGPCGPCSEIFYDHGKEVWGGPPGTPDEDGDRYIEIWNLVFMQFDRQADGTMIPLPKPSVDTGMGLERIAAILQGVHSNYEIDIFVELIQAAAELTNTTDLDNDSLKVIADHIRAVSFLIIDGVIPSNEGRGYVLRRIIRRAVRHGYKLGQKNIFFYKLVDKLVELMGEAYPELSEQADKVKSVIEREEERFAKTLVDGMATLEQDIANITDNTISGETLFKLYDTYGFPVDLTCDIARERGLAVDIEGYEARMKIQQQTSQQGGGFKSDVMLKVEGKTDFKGYDNTTTQAKINALFINGESVDGLAIGDEAIVVLEQTPFYAEGGGQIGDTGNIVTEAGKFVVKDTQKQGEVFLHIGVLQSGSLSVGEEVTAEFDSSRRQAIKRNHSATHLLHSALRRVLGDSAEQKGSLVSEERLRFDFSYDRALDHQQLSEIERLANEEVLANHPVEANIMSQEAAKAKGAMALFGEKYGDEVRVLTMGPNSIELCGGTHVNRTGDIGQIIITGQSSVAAGIRRIEAVTGWGAIVHRKNNEALSEKVMGLVKANAHNFENKITQLINDNKELKSQVKRLAKGAFQDHGATFSGSQREVNGYRIMTGQMEGVSVSELRDIADNLRDKNNLDLVLGATVEEGKAKLVISVAKSQIGKLHAGKIIAEVAKIVDGKGGGRADFAQAGGNAPDKIKDALVHLDKILQDY